MLSPALAAPPTPAAPRGLRPPSAARHRLSPYVTVALLAGFLSFHRLGHRDLTSSHEARAAQNARRMLDDRSFGLPVLFDGQIDLQKPPGYYWLVAACGSANGDTVDAFAARLPAALAGLIGVLTTFAFLRHRGRPAAAWVAALGLATAVHYTGMARTARIDMPLAAAAAGAVLAFHVACEPGRRRRLGWLLVASSCAAVAALLKGPIGVVLVGATAALSTLVERRLREPADRPALPIGPLAAAAVAWLLLALPWFIWAAVATDGEFVRAFVWHHNVERFLGTSPTLASHPWWDYGPKFAADFLPWTPALALLVGWGLRRGLWRTDPLFRLGLVWFAAMFAVLSTSQFKRADYLLPAYPGAAIALGCAAEAWYASRASERSRAFSRWGFAATVAAAVVGWQAMTYAIEPRLTAKDEKRAFAAAIRAAAPPPHRVLLFRAESHLLAFHLGRPVHTLVEWGELNDLLNAPGPHYLVTQPPYAEEAAAILPHHKLEAVCNLRDFTGVRPARPLVFLRSAK